MTKDTALDLDSRTGWPKSLRFLLDRHPRESWPAHPNLGALCRFWMERHRMFRELGGALHSAALDLHEGRLDAGAFQPWFEPRMRFFLQQLHHHHQIEDHTYFPVFMGAEPRLEQGFETLEGDHATLHEAIRSLADASNTLSRSLRQRHLDLSAATARLGFALPDVLRRLARHLDDEEDLIIPLMLERGEAAFDVG